MQTVAEVSDALTHVGVRSHQIVFSSAGEEENTFPCWLVATSETPHEMTLYLRLHGAPKPGDAPHLQADLPKETWRSLNQEPQPWLVKIDPARLLLLRG